MGRGAIADKVDAAIRANKRPLYVVYATGRPGIKKVRVKADIGAEYWLPFRAAAVSDESVSLAGKFCVPRAELKEQSVSDCALLLSRRSRRCNGRSVRT